MKICHPLPALLPRSGMFPICDNAIQSMKTFSRHGFSLAFNLLLALVSTPILGHASTAGTLIGWGPIDSYGVPLTSQLTNVVSAAVGSEHVLALNGDGTVLGWSNGNDFGAGKPPKGLTNIISIA